MRNNCITDLLNIQGVIVKDIKNEENLDVFIETKSKMCKCPKCGHYTKNVKDYYNQKIQHTPICNKNCFLHLRKRRLVCKYCGKAFYEDVPFLQKYFRKSNVLFDKVIKDLKQLKNFKTVAQDNNISVPTVIRFLNYQIFMDNKYYHTTILPEHIGIDEFKGNCGGNKYLFHVFNLDTHETIDIVNGKSYDVLEKYFSNIQNRKDVKIVSMDLCNSFKRIIKDKFINAEIVADCFHFTRSVMNCLDELRLNIWRKAKGKEKKYFSYLKTSLMKDTSKVTEKDTEKLLHAFENSPILKYGYIIKNKFLNIKKATSFEEKELLFRKWLEETESSTIKEYSTCIKTLRQWHEYISNYFKYSLSNGPTEGKNNLVKVVKRMSFGFRNFNNFRNRLLMLNLK